MTRRCRGDDLAVGGRITLDAWVGTQPAPVRGVRLSSALDFAPEITGYRSLRLMMSGVY